MDYSAYYLSKFTIYLFTELNVIVINTFFITIFFLILGVFVLANETCLCFKEQVWSKPNNFNKDIVSHYAPNRQTIFTQYENVNLKTIMKIIFRRNVHVFRRCFRVV